MKNSHKKFTPRHLIPGLVLLMAAMALAATPLASAATILVDVHPDSGAGVVEIDDNDGLCSLREAIENANDNAQTHEDCAAGEGADTIILPAGAVFTLTDPAGSFGSFGATGLPPLASAITIEGNGATIQRDASVTCNNNNVADPGEFRLLLIQSGADFTARDLTLANGCADGEGDDRTGGAIYNNRGGLTLERVTVRDNLARIRGGGVFQRDGGPLARIEASTFSGNQASNGGALSAAGDIGLRNVTLSGNSTTSRGGRYFRIWFCYAHSGAGHLLGQLSVSCGGRHPSCQCHGPGQQRDPAEFELW